MWSLIFRLFLSPKYGENKGEKEMTILYSYSGHKIVLISSSDSVFILYE